MGLKKKKKNSEYVSKKVIMIVLSLLKLLKADSNSLKI